MHVSVNEPVWRRLLEHVGLADYGITIEIANRHSGPLRGEWYSGRRAIRLYPNSDFIKAQKLRDAHTRLVLTFLHELRHAWQDRYRPDVVERSERFGYSIKPEEEDANEWAAANLAPWRWVLKVSNPTTTSRGFSKLAATQKGR